MIDKPIRTKEALERRLNRYFAQTRPKFGSVFELVERLRPLGTVAVFGGTLRDFYLKGPNHNPRDVDLVVDTQDYEKLECVLRNSDPHRNKFGGYRLRIGQWMVDIWPVSSTWAFRMGHVDLCDLSQLPKTTFLTSDAVVFVLGEGKVFCTDEYLDLLNSRVLDVNLEPNPNPLGCLVRALRAAVVDGFDLNHRLTRFVVQHYKEYELDINDAIRVAFGYEVDASIVKQTLQEMERHFETLPALPFHVDTKLWHSVAQSSSFGLLR